MIRRSALVGIALGALAWAGCGADHDPSDPPVARAYGNILYWSDLRQVVPMDASASDSAALAAGFVENWMREQVLLANAEKNLPASGMDLEARMRDYRNSLVIFTYEQALVDEKLDTVITQLQIAEHFGQHAKDFALKDNIVRVRWFKVDDHDPRLVKRLRKQFESDKNEDMHELEVWAASNGVVINDTQEDWVAFQTLCRSVPIRTENATDWLERNDKVVLEDSAGTYFVDLLEHRAVDSEPPIEMVAQDIRSILLNQRKVKLIERMREDLYKQALEHDEIGVY
ncbi:MAG: hypothetical protein KA175_06155 [Flavobacteriales bacterium]|nr:hypothetical protein [Flavobacteriales bacterium]MBP6697182.1 hypothetical protein [Flavobacteriales bacterium]